ncbi:hypothetical protein IF1G_01476 [Cordyceps javanica]|uniref:Uncharacterized protein n=1 Tax=Cordyceps javanica TaxID=43265 RepID=A0A545VBY4_9HYPO|nr:hypothetical protein IF1G_01476 [Cordyceps javanica]
MIPTRPRLAWAPSVLVRPTPPKPPQDRRLHHPEKCDQETSKSRHPAQISFPRAGGRVFHAPLLQIIHSPSQIKVQRCTEATSPLFSHACVARPNVKMPSPITSGRKLTACYWKRLRNDTKTSIPFSGIHAV